MLVAAPPVREAASGVSPVAKRCSKRPRHAGAPEDGTPGRTTPERTPEKNKKRSMHLPSSQDMKRLRGTTEEEDFEAFVRVLADVFRRVSHLEVGAFKEAVAAAVVGMRKGGEKKASFDDAVDVDACLRRICGDGDGRLMVASDGDGREVVYACI